MRRSWTLNHVQLKSLKYISDIIYVERSEIIVFGYWLNDAINVLFVLDKCNT